MPSLTINNRRVEVPPGHTILQAARVLGVEIPTLCHLDGLRPNTACMLCVVEVKGRRDLVPSCAAPAVDGLDVETDSPTVREARRVNLELLLSTHVGDCCAPCQHTCPLHMDIPQMLRQLAAGDVRGAVATVRAAIALPAVLGRVCPQLCERTCRRGLVDQAAAICELKRYVADVDMANGAARLPAQRPHRGQRVAIIGSGPAGLAAAYHLLLDGYDCVLFERSPRLGGRLRTDFDEGTLPPEVIDEEVLLIERLGADVRMGVTVGDADLAALRTEFDAVLVAVGRLAGDCTHVLGLPVVSGRLHTQPNTHETDLPGVFAAGDASHFNHLVVRCVADGKSAAEAIDRHLNGRNAAVPHAFHVRTGHVCREEVVPLVAPGRTDSRMDAVGAHVTGLTLPQIQREAARCLHCDCAARDRCRLRAYAAEYGARSSHFPVHRQPLERVGSAGGVVFEPGKCILCGICVQIAGDAPEPLGLTFLGRGFDTRVGVPFGGTFADGLACSARRCIDACPTGALSYAP